MLKHLYIAKFRFATNTLIKSGCLQRLFTILWVAFLVACGNQNAPSEALSEPSNQAARAITPATDGYVFFPKQKEPEGDAIWTTLEARIDGELMEVEGCLRFGIGESEDESVFPIWPPEAVLILNDGQYQVYDAKSQITLSIGEKTSMGGGVIPLAFAIERTDGPFPDCAGPYWLVGELTTSK